MNVIEDNPDRTTEFVRLFAENSQKIRWFIRSAVATPDAAEEVFQETSAALWENFGGFQLGTDFAAWAVRVAHFRILKFRSRQARDSRVFSDLVVEELLVDTAALADDLDQRRRWLANCFAKLSAPDHDLVARRYAPGANSRKVSQQLGRSPSYVSKALARIHSLLFECIARHEAQEGASS